MADYILSIDQGTTGTTAIILNISNPKKPNVIAKANQAFSQHYPKNGWVEHDLDEIWSSVRTACQKAMAQAMENEADFSVKKIGGLGLSNQRETLCVYDTKTLAPEGPAIVWQCRRSVDICHELRGSD